MVHRSGACMRCRKGATIRYAGDMLAFWPLVIDDAQIAGLFALVAGALKETE
ncbi:hypothetical protein [Burkholderia sp. S-53]|uniref:hypothetical protein n=1 Tax=Burkholderia sp. S-53 TaxID=2906514 RepID=UPI0021D1FF29|nr:hypothetical protein LXM88_09360 [Burkholderia sp. S-53]